MRDYLTSSQRVSQRIQSAMNKSSVVSLQEQNKCGMVSLVSAWFVTGLAF
jgi:hypothetical protein